MAKSRRSANFTEELAHFLASRPTRDTLLNYHPSRAAALRAEALLPKQNDGRASREEQEELEEFTCAERLMRLVKAQLRTRKVS